MGDDRYDQRTLIIPDLHERLYIVETELYAELEKAPRVVFLGDWFDTFSPYSEDRVRRVCQWLVSKIELRPNWDFLLGNHDVHYASGNEMYACSGFSSKTLQIVQEMIPPDLWRCFKIYTKVGPYLVSHAGFTERTLQYAKPEVERDAIEQMLRGKYDPLLGAGRARGGSLMEGGPLWLDWYHEFQHIPSTPQIVGHTQDKKVRSKGTDEGLKSWCIDTANRHYMLVDEETGVVDVVEL